MNYARKEFEGYTTRFKVEFDAGEFNHYIDIYSDSPNVNNLKKFINDNLKDKLTKFRIIHIATKEQDEKASELINEILNN